MLLQRSATGQGAGEKWRGFLAKPYVADARVREIGLICFFNGEKTFVFVRLL